MKIEDLKIGDIIYSFESRIGLQDWECYHFHEIVSETIKFWICGSKKVRKCDLKIFGDYGYMELMNIDSLKAYELQKQDGHLR